jgi:hypothetical protein
VFKLIKLTNAVEGLELYALVLLSLVVLSCNKTNKCCCRAGIAGCGAVKLFVRLQALVLMNLEMLLQSWD